MTRAQSRTTTQRPSGRFFRLKNHLFDFALEFRACGDRHAEP
jgi:hypothetical protein